MCTCVPAPRPGWLAGCVPTTHLLGTVPRRRSGAARSKYRQAQAARPARGAPWRRGSFLIKESKVIYIVLNVANNEGGGGGKKTIVAKSTAAQQQKHANCMPRAK